MSGNSGDRHDLLRDHGDRRHSREASSGARIRLEAHAEGWPATTARANKRLNLMRATEPPRLRMLTLLRSVRETEFIRGRNDIMPAQRRAGTNSEEK